MVKNIGNVFRHTWIVVNNDKNMGKVGRAAHLDFSG